MLTIEASLEELFKRNPEFLKACQRLGWGQIEIVVKEGKPVMVRLMQDIKLS
jgi:hypothetical protein